MMDMIPPASQVSMNICSLAELYATIPGNLKMPEPITIPTIIIITSKSDSVCFGCVWSFDVLIETLSPHMIDSNFRHNCAGT